MDELVKGIFGAPIGTLFIIAGLVFLGIAVIGKISGKIEPGKGGRIASGVIGIILLGIGMFFYTRGSDPLTIPTPTTETLTSTMTPTEEIPTSTITPTPEVPTLTPTPTLELVSMRLLDTTFGGGLITSWESSEDGRTWTFNLMENVYLHDGNPLTAYVVREKLEDLPSVSSGFATIEIVDDYTITLQLATASTSKISDLLDEMSTVDYVIIK